MRVLEPFEAPVNAGANAMFSDVAFYADAACTAPAKVVPYLGTQPVSRVRVMVPGPLSGIVPASASRLWGRTETRDGQVIGGPVELVIREDLSA